MKNILILAIFLVLTLFSSSQSKDVEIVKTQDSKGVIISAVNNSNVQQEITLTIISKNLRGYKAPIKKLISSKTTVEIIKLLFIKNKKGEFRISYRYKPNLTEEEKAEQNKELEEKLVAEVGDVKKGIVVFSKDGCPRCHYTTRFMLDNNIDFRLVNTSKSNNQNLFMWELLKKKNPIIKRLTMPVILVNGEISYNIDDLKEFVSNLKKQ